MPVISISSGLGSTISAEPFDKLKDICRVLKAVHNNKNYLQLHGKALYAPITGKVDRAYFESLFGQFNASKYFGSGGEGLSSASALVIVKELMFDKLMDGYNIDFTHPSQREMDTACCKIFFDSLSGIPSVEDRREFIHIATGCAVLHQFGLFALNSDSLPGNGTVVCGQESLSDLLLDYVTFKSLQRVSPESATQLLDQILKGVILGQVDAQTAFAEIPPVLKLRLLKRHPVIGAVLHSRELENYTGSLNIGPYSTFKDTIQNGLPYEWYCSLSCTQVNWPDSAFYDVIIEDCLFAGANLQNLQLKNVDCSGSIFSGANLSGAKFKYVNCSRCDFSGANLTDLYCDRVNFSGAVLSNARISLSPECIEESLRAPITRNQDLWRNGCVPEKGIGNLLESIHSIDPAYQEQKNALMRSVIERLHHVNDDELQSHLAPLVEVLFKHPGYIEEPEVATFTQRLLVLWLRRKQQELCRSDEVDPDLVLNLFNRQLPIFPAALERYGKTLDQLRAFSGAQAARLQTQAITGETARN
jgi:hypothetical protein